MLAEKLSDTVVVAFVSGGCYPVTTNWSLRFPSSADEALHCFSECSEVQGGNGEAIKPDLSVKVGGHEILSVDSCVALNFNM